MSNTLTNIQPLLLKQALMTLRQNAILPRLVNVDYAPTPAEHGTPIQISVYRPATIYSVSPGSAGSATGINPNKITITMDNWKGTSFELNDKEINEAMVGVIPGQMAEHVKSLANNIDNAIIQAMYEQVGSIYGTTSAPDGADDVTGVMERLDNTLCPQDSRYLVLNSLTKREFLEIASFTQADQTGDPTGRQISGRLGTIYNFDTYMDQNLNNTSLTVGTVGSNATEGNNQVDVNGALSAGATSMAVDGAGLATGTILTGTKFEFAGLDQEFTVMDDVTLAANAGTVTFQPQLPSGIANDTKVTFKSSYTVHGLGFRREALALCVRPFPEVQSGLGSLVMQEVDPVTGLSLRLEMTRSNKVTRFELDILYGLAVVRPEYACILAQFTGTGTAQS